jgi:hypothetical protein
MPQKRKSNPDESPDRGAFSFPDSSLGDVSSVISSCDSFDHSAGSFWHLETDLASGGFFNAFGAAFGVLPPTVVFLRFKGVRYESRK